MKEKLSDEIRDIIAQVKLWISCEAEYAKLTLAEKLYKNVFVHDKYLQNGF